jgi:hypothetical protein
VQRIHCEPGLALLLSPPPLTNKQTHHMHRPACRQARQLLQEGAALGLAPMDVEGALLAAGGDPDAVSGLLPCCC